MTTSYGGTPPGITGTHYGGAGIGVLGSLVPSSGLSGAGYLYAGLSLPADASKEVRGPITRWPTNGTLTAYEDSSFAYTGTTDYALYALYVDGVASTTNIGYGAGIGRLDLQIGVSTSQLSGGVTLANVVAAGSVVGYSVDTPLARPVFSLSIGTAGIRIGSSRPQAGQVRIGSTKPDGSASG